MEILKTIKAEGLNANPSEETLNKANRPISNVGAGLYRNGFTVIPSAKVYGKTYSINGSTREGAVLYLSCMTKTENLLKRVQFQQMQFCANCTQIQIMQPHQNIKLKRLINTEIRRLRR